ncbi:MAG TPA: hypothetical protein VKE51_15305 [Vicinamibacterales bacterium]|nr:hypothetical protein [Vicinamibacterales bacterium]
MWLVAAATAAQEQTPTQQGAQLTILQLDDVYELGAANGLGGAPASQR